MRRRDADNNPRGSHEIGGSCVEIIHNKSRIIVDIGIPLVDSEGNKFDAARYKNSGQELVKQGVLPDLKGFIPGMIFMKG